MNREREKLDEQKDAYDRATKGPKTLKDVKYGLYDKIKSKVSVKTMDVIIYAIVGLIILALALGIAFGK